MPARLSTAASGTPVHSALLTAPSSHCRPPTFGREKNAAIACAFQGHRDGSRRHAAEFLVTDFALLLDTPVDMKVATASRSSFGTAKWLRTKNCSFEVMKLLSAEKGNSRFSGFRSRTMRPGKGLQSQRFVLIIRSPLHLSSLFAQLSLQDRLRKEQNAIALIENGYDLSHRFVIESSGRTLG